MLDEDRLRALADDIAANGQTTPCVMDSAGLGLDGRNRVAACRLINVDPAWTVHDGDPLAVIKSTNERRDLTTGQRAMWTALVLVEQGQRSNGRFKRGAIPAGNHRSMNNLVAQAGAVLDHAPNLVQAVLDGTTALDAAVREASENKAVTEMVAKLSPALASLYESGVITIEDARRRARDEQRVAKLDPDLAERVESGGISVDEAETIERERAERLQESATTIDQAVHVLLQRAGYTLPLSYEPLLGSERYALINDLMTAWQQWKDYGHE